MDIVFTCPSCRQELAVDEAGSGNEIECPECGNSIMIPEPSPANIRATPPPRTTQAVNTLGGSKERKHTIQVVHKPALAIERSAAPLDTEAKGTGRKPMIKCFRRADFAAQGTDAFDKAVSQFLQGTDPANIHGVTPIQYSYVDAKSGHVLNDYGVLVYYKG
jgi:DNA-directed RNA polymerase subunit RPC12/RpoP